MLNSVKKNWRQSNYESLMAEVTVLKQVLIAYLADTRSQAVAPGQPLRVLRRAAGQSQQVKPRQVKERHRQTAVAAELSEPDLTQIDDSAVGDFDTDSDVDLDLDEVDEISPGVSSMLDHLCRLFNLSLFDRQLLVLCVGVELDAELPALCAEISQQPYPSLGLALAVFGGHCSALAPDSPLRYYQLVEQQQDHHSFVKRSLTASQWVLFYLTAAPGIDPLLMDCLRPVSVLAPLLESHQQSAAQLRRSWRHQRLRQSRPGPGDTASVAQLVAATGDDYRQVAALAAAADDRIAYELNLYHLPLRNGELGYFRRVLERELLAQQCLLIVDCQRLYTGAEPEIDIYPLRSWLDRLLRDLPACCVLAGRQPVSLPSVSVQCQHLPALSQTEQVQLWRHCLLPDAEPQQGKPQNGESVAEVMPGLTTALQGLSTQFNLTSQQVRTIACCAEQTASDDPQALVQSLWQHSREQCRQPLQGLAQVIAPGAVDWDDLVLPAPEKNTLQAILAQVNQRQRVYRHWGFAKQVPYGLGISALFVGSSGTGKTMAARIIASRLQLDLYHVDLSSVVDKYIGETEKNLDKIFQAAENSGAVLLFDEADALFGKRSKVQDARDRYANMGISFLLQRMESYSGLSILTTNLRSAMDDAFVRRLRFIVQFPFPGETERQQLWRCMIPASAPTADIDYAKLARLTLAGGSIRNIALQAAFVAADEQQSISMQYLRDAARQECIKTEKTLDENLVRDW